MTIGEAVQGNNSLKILVGVLSGVISVLLSIGIINAYGMITEVKEQQKFDHDQVVELRSEVQNLVRRIDRLVMVVEKVHGGQP